MYYGTCQVPTVLHRTYSILKMETLCQLFVPVPGMIPERDQFSGINPLITKDRAACVFGDFLVCHCR
jgi:hypothetical protein